MNADGSPPYHYRGTNGHFIRPLKAIALGLFPVASLTS